MYDMMGKITMSRLVCNSIVKGHLLKNFICYTMMGLVLSA